MNYMELRDKLEIAISEEQCKNPMDKRQMVLTINSKWVNYLVEYYCKLICINVPKEVSNITFMEVKVIPSDFIDENTFSIGYLNQF